jgi:MFS family permease
MTGARSRWIGRPPPAPSLAALGLAAFSLTMGLGRLAADPLAGRLGRVAVVRSGALLASAGLALALASASAAIGIAGFALTGAGLAAVFALALNAAGKTAGPAAPSLAAAATSGYAAFIAGPALIGLITEATNLALVGVLCLAAAALAPSARERNLRRRMSVAASSAFTSPRSLRRYRIAG